MENEKLTELLQYADEMQKDESLNGMQRGIVRQLATALATSTAREKAWHDNVMLASGGHASTPEGAAEVIRQLRDMLDGVKERERGLSLEVLRSANQRRQKEWDQKDVIDLSYRGNELAGEVGEACNVIKKLERERLGIGGSRDTIEHLAEELADVIICADLIAMKIGIDLGAAVVAKFNKTSEANRLSTRLAAHAQETK